MMSGSSYQEYQANGFVEHETPGFSEISVTILIAVLFFYADTC